MAGLNFYHAVAQALEAGKLFHIDLNAQKPGRFDQDLRFGQEDVKIAFFLVRLLETSGYDGPRHFDAHALRTSDPEDVWAFAAGCMRSYLILREKAARFDADPEVREILAQINAGDPEPGGASVGLQRTERRRSRRAPSMPTRSPPSPALRAAGPAALRHPAGRILRSLSGAPDYHGKRKTRGAARKFT